MKRTWVEINEEIFAMEREKSVMEYDPEWRARWNTLLSEKVAGILKRDKYEEPEGEKGRERPKEKRGHRKDVGTVP